MNYGRIIISELFVPVANKTIKPANLTGVAGGTKYVVRGILFKLCQDPQIRPGYYLYGGATPNFEYALKSANLELRGAMLMFPFYTLGIRVPLQACIEFQGNIQLCGRNSFC